MGRAQLAGDLALINRHPEVLREIHWGASTWTSVLAALPDCPGRFLPEILANDSLPDGALAQYPYAVPDADTALFQHPRLQSLLLKSPSLQLLSVEYPAEFSRVLLNRDPEPEIKATALLLFLRRWIALVYARHSAAVARACLRELAAMAHRRADISSRQKYLNLQVRLELRRRHFARLVVACTGDDVDDVPAQAFITAQHSQLMQEIPTPEFSTLSITEIQSLSRASLPRYFMRPTLAACTWYEHRRYARTAVPTRINGAFVTKFTHDTRHTSETKSGPDPNPADTACALRRITPSSRLAHPPMHLGAKTIAPYRDQPDLIAEDDHDAVARYADLVRRDLLCALPDSEVASIKAANGASHEVL